MLIGIGNVIEAFFQIYSRNKTNGVIFRLIQKKSNCALGIRAKLIKRIPSLAGLGGGSSDAAAALVAANLLWDLNYSNQQLSEFAAELGSDIPFFLYQSHCVCRGHRDRVLVAGHGQAHHRLDQPARPPHHRRLPDDDSDHVRGDQPDRRCESTLR